MKKFGRLSAFLETSSGVTPSVGTIKRFIKTISAFGYDRLYLGMADSYKIEGEPYFGYKRGGYTTAELAEIDAYAKRKKIEVVPQIQLLGHLHYLKKYPIYEPLFDTNDSLIVGDERVYALIDKMIKTVSEGLSSRTIHIGLDETFGLGTGNYLKNHEPADRKELILRHVEKVSVILEKYGYSSVEMWGDMLLDEKSTVSFAETKKRLKKNSSVVVWNYEEKDEGKLGELISNAKKITDNPAFAGGVWKYLGFGPNNAFSIDCLLSQLKTCEKNGVENFIVTLWSDNVAPCSSFAALPSLYVVAEYAYGRMNDLSELDKDRFALCAGISYDDLYSLEYLDNPFKEDCVTRSSSSVWVLYSDILLGNFDTLIPANAEKAYLSLAEKYSSLARGAYGYIFGMSAALTETLALKAHIPEKTRAAYLSGNREAMKDVVEKLKALKKSLKRFLRLFEEYFLHDNKAFGVEVYHSRIGDRITRCDYAVKRLNAFISRGEKIEELEGGVLPLLYDPMPTISCSIMTDPRLLVSYCI